jgi:hypothetical protein
MELAFKDWIEQRNEGVLDTLALAGDKMARTQELTKKVWDRFHLIARKPSQDRRSKLVEKTYDDILAMLENLQQHVINGAESVATSIASMPPLSTAHSVSELPGLKQIKWIVRTLWNIIGGPKILHAFLDATPRTMWRPIKTFFHWIFKEDVEAKEIGKSMVNLTKLIPALSFTGALKLTLPWQLQWFGWTLEEGLQYNFALAWGMYFIYIVANLVKGNNS